MLGWVDSGIEGRYAVDLGPGRWVCCGVFGGRVGDGLALVRCWTESCAVVSRLAGEIFEVLRRSWDLNVVPGCAREDVPEKMCFLTILDYGGPRNCLRIAMDVDEAKKLTRWFYRRIDMRWIVVTCPPESKSYDLPKLLDQYPGHSTSSFRTPVFSNAKATRTINIQMRKLPGLSQPSCNAPRNNH